MRELAAENFVASSAGATPCSPNSSAARAQGRTTRRTSCSKSAPARAATGGAVRLRAVPHTQVCGKAGLARRRAVDKKAALKKKNGIRRSLRWSRARVYSKLKCKSGVHRVQRAGDRSERRIHTSTVTVAVLPKPRSRRADDPKDLRVDTFARAAVARASTPRNRPSDHAHEPSCPAGRKTQIKNRAKAMKVLRSPPHEMEPQTAGGHAKDPQNQVGTGERSEDSRIARNRITDHRVFDAPARGGAVTSQALENVSTHYQSEKLKGSHHAHVTQQRVLRGLPFI